MQIDPETLKKFPLSFPRCYALNPLQKINIKTEKKMLMIMRRQQQDAANQKRRMTDGTGETTKTSRRLRESQYSVILKINHCLMRPEF